MFFKNIKILDEFFKIQEDMSVLIKGGRIVYIGREVPENTEEVYEGKNKLLMPGFVNSHAHTPMTLLRGYSENQKLQDWLVNSVFPFESKMNEQDVFNGMMLGIAEMLRFGIVSTTDMYFKCEEMCRAALVTKTKFNISNGMTCFDGSRLADNKSYKDTENMLREYHNANDGAIIVDASIHGEYTSNPDIVREMVEYALKNGLNMHVHLSETELEHRESIERRGKTPARYFSDLGVFDVNTTAAHCVWVSDEDIDVLAEKNVTVSTNAMSNLKLASGVCRVPYMMKKGVNVSIGTDGVASNNSLNFLEEIKLFAVLHKGVNYNPEIITPEEAIRAATLNGFQAQGRKDSGLVKEGYKADLIVIDMDKPNYYPAHNILNNIVYSSAGSDVCLTMADGNILYKDGEYYTLDIEKVKFEAVKSVEKILNK